MNWHDAIVGMFVGWFLLGLPVVIALVWKELARAKKDRWLP